MSKQTVNVLKAHIAINVKDVGKSTEFYRTLFGIEPAKMREGYAKFDVSNPPINLALNAGAPNERADNERGRLSHLGIQVRSTADVLAMRQQWADRGLFPRDEMGTECCFALQDKSWVRDPDGNEWEVFAVLEDNLPEKTAKEASCCAATCCAPVAV